ncbi:hypothetical protein MKW92_018702 [Papaver armeniacum]|nr:hypothetical protein MKW92_018702 [Papaver armeniacum]
MEVDEEETTLNTTTSSSLPQPSAVPSHDNLTSTIATTNLPLLPTLIAPPPPVGVLPIISAINLAPPLPPQIIPPIAPIPLAPIPRPPVILPPHLGTAEQNGSDSDSDDEESGPNKSMDYEISEESRQVRERQEKIMQDHLLKRRAYALAVPTNDSAVRARLRRLGEPVTLFGEREMERRDRLRKIMVNLDPEHQDKLFKAHEDEEAANAAAADDSDGEGPQQYPFYTEGSQELLQARINIAKYSIVKAALRLERAKRRRDDPDEDFDAEIDWALKQAGSLELDCSEIGDDRPLTGCSFSCDGEKLATCALNGATRLWSMPRVSRIVAPFKGHTERTTDVAFSPVSSDLLATASADRTAILWNTEGRCLRKYEGHLDRLARVAFHPTGKYLATASFDKTWRMWDVETGVELLFQEGHSRSVYGICFHHDGSLAASCGLDSLARVWDLRSGRSILSLEGHVKPVYGINFSPNGYHLATGGEDNTCRIWDLRKKKSLYIIPAHSNLISQVKFDPQEGYFLATASYDMTAKLWSARDFKPIKTLSGHESKVSSLDIVGDGQYIATVSHDRTIKLWASRSNGNGKAMDID